MKQNEHEKSAENLLSANTTTSATTTTATSTVQTQPESISTTNAENAHKKNTKAATAASHATRMTDESNNDNNNDSSSSKSVNKNGNLIAEAAKILLKNGLNGTSAAAAALLTAATSYQLPTITLPTASLGSNPGATSTLLSRSVIECIENQLDPPPAHVASSNSSSSSNKGTTMSSAVASPRSSGLPPAPSHFKSTAKDANLGTTSGATFLGKPISTHAAETGVIDYTVNTASNGTQKPLSAASSGSGFNHGGGGRLQFFKDGKFILELARSKDGERGGWVSVPRKHFRQPSATTSTVTPASTASACVYPKMESSTSLSFSDDNSSIQSSPWQRDHCWKQTTPKRGISKEMMVYYRVPKDVTITKAGLRLAKLKRRRPYDDTIDYVKDQKLFERREENMSGQEKNLNSEGKTRQSINHRLQNGSTNTSCTTKCEEEDCCSTSSVATLVGENENNHVEEANEKSNTSTPTNGTRPKDESLSQIVQSTDNVTDTANSAVCQADVGPSNTTTEQIHVKNDADIILEVEKMNTSEDEHTSITPIESQQSFDTSTSNNNKQALNTVDVGNESPSAQNQSKTGVEEKRLIKRKVERAKLTSIVQKLIDRMPARVSNLAKVPLLNSSISSNAQQNSSFLCNKVSPTSSSSSTSPLISTTSTSATASRLVESHHQQHVSPRKRILREFEKVSLEDTVVTCGAGGKRSRARSNANPVISSNYQNSRSPNNRVHSNVCSVPASGAGFSSLSAMSSSSNGENLQNLCSPIITTKYSKNSAPTNVPPTRVYSSYSIHSLLGDQANSSSGSSCSSSTAGNKAPEQSSTLTSNIGYNQHIQHQQKPEHSFQFRKSVSPKSPEAGGGKSPSSNAANKKRSPPYASSIHDSLSRSPSVGNSIDYSPRATPPEIKQRYGATGLADTQQTHLHHQQHHRHLQQSGFYSPYMMSPKYVPGTATIATGTTSPPSTSRSPRHSTTAFTSPTTSTTITSVNTKNIPNSYSPHLAAPVLQHELSPSRSLAEYPRDSTPRTVPKKTASIRRQFASPTASTSTNSNTSSSPSERGIEEILSDAKTSNSVTTAAYQQLQQRGSPSAVLPSPLHAAYYMYPPTGPLQFGGNAVAGGNVSTSGSSPISHVAPTSYIPSYYHSYLSALNITKHYYMGNTGMSQSAVSRLSSPFHPMAIPYNGVSAAAVAAAAAAAAATAAFSGQPHMGHHPMLPPASAASAAALYGVGGGFGLGLNAVPTSSTSTVQHTNKSTDCSLTITNANIMREATMSAAATTTALAQPAQFTSNKDELSSDVPLNLSKH